MGGMTVAGFVAWATHLTDAIAFGMTSAMVTTGGLVLKGLTKTT